ncbi:MAG: hypothetical protein AB7O62_14265 [Pirellulales bacterium]
MSRRVRWSGWMLAGCLLAALSGCSGSTLPELKGSLKINGQVLPGATVVLQPKTGGGTICYGEVGVDGNFTVNTGGLGGVTAGEYIVTVMNRTAIGPDGTAAPVTGPAIPPRYTDPKTSDLTITVKESGNEPLNIDLKQ